MDGALGSADPAPVGGSPPESVSQSGGFPTRALLMIAGLGAAVIHLSFAPAHLDSNTVHGAFFVAVGWAQLAWVAALAFKPTPLVYRLGVVLNAVVIGVWVVSRTIGFDGVEPVGFPDTVATVLAAFIVVGASGVGLRFLDRVRVRELSSGVMLGAAAAVSVAALASAAMVPSLSGHSSSEAGGHHHGGPTASASAETAAAGHHHGASAAADPDGGPPSDGEPAASADHGHAGAEHVSVAVPYDPELPIDLGGIDGVTPQQQAEAENLVATTVSRLPQWSDSQVAERAGFRSIGDGATGTEHLVNQEFMDDDVILDPDKPESLVYSTDGGGRRLVAAMYMVAPGTPLSEVPQLGGKLMQWHTHQNLCYGPDRTLAGITDAAGNCPPGTVKPAETPMIHVWIERHPCGPFAALEGIGGGTIAEGEERLCDSAHGG